MVRGIIFDYGGTLDTHGDHWSEVIWEAYLWQKNMESDSVVTGDITDDNFAQIHHEEFRAAYVHAERSLDGSDIILPSDTFRDVMRKKIGIQLDYLDAFTTRRCESIAQRCYESAKSCVMESSYTLRVLSESYPIVIVSNFYGNLHTVLDDFGLSRYIVAAIDSASAGIRKPDPAIFSLGIEALGRSIAPKERKLTPEEILVVGDSITKDILPADTLGCHTVLLSGKPWDPSRPQPPLPSDTVKITTLADIPDLLKSHFC